MSDNNVSDDGLSLSASVAVNKQILEVMSFSVLLYHDQYIEYSLK